jgi:hypothetical protein
MNPKQYRKFAFRTNAYEIAEWACAAAKQNKPLAAFIRDAAHRARAGMSSAELNRHLVMMRSLLNAAMSVRTPDQKNQRIAAVRDHLTAMIHRKPKGWTDV